MKPLLSLEKVSKYYQPGTITVKALENISLNIYQGEFIAIIGQSGSGKSTLMNILGCLDKPTDGTYQVNGNHVENLSNDDLASLRRNTFGFIFQRYNLLSTETAVENVELPALYSGIKKEQRQERAIQLLTDLGIGSRGEHYPNELSGGQQQRVAIARALMNNPHVILADEPTGALDSQSGSDVLSILTKLNEQGHTIIVITHDEQVSHYAKRIVKIKDGCIIDDSNTPKFNDNYTCRYSLNNNNQHTNITSDTGEAIRTALRALRANFFRTALTLLGIVIGVASVVTMLAVGNGSKQNVLSRIQALGTNLLSVRPGAPGIRSRGEIATLSMDDAKELEKLPNIVVVVPERNGRKTVRFRNTDYATNIEGVGSGFPIARDWPLEYGQFFTIKDVESFTPVAVLGSTVSKILFPDGRSPVGEYLLIGNIPFQVVGAMDSKGAAPWGRDQDDTVWIPVTTSIIRLFGGFYLNGITIKVVDAKNIQDTEQQIIELLKQRHGTEDFSVRNTASYLTMATETQNTLTMLLGTVAAISLLVGGIGVMNIMLVSVTERTHEIGIRMATGARMSDIMIQFITEAAVVCTIGGVLGVTVGIIAGVVLSWFEVNILFSLAPAILAFSCAVLTGLIFGYLPARKAAHLDPVIALGTE